MPDANDAFSTLDDFLLSLADGVTYAQASLARLGVSGPAGAQVVYQLPRVDFELNMNLTVVDDPVISQRYSPFGLTRFSNKHILFRPILADEASSSTLTIAATIKGAFVAIPANNGQPIPLITTTVQARQPRAPVIIARITNTAGEVMSNVAVEFNVDREATIALNQALDTTVTVDTETLFGAGMAITAADGQATATLQIPPSQQPCVLVLTIDAQGQTETLAYEVKA